MKEEMRHINNIDKAQMVVSRYCASSRDESKRKLRIKTPIDMIAVFDLRKVAKS